MDCAKLSKGLVLDACKRAIAGLRGTVILINYDDIDRVATIEANNVVSTLQLKNRQIWL